MPGAIGRRAAPTTAGRFYVRNKLSRFRSAMYGPLAFGTSARSALTDWPGGGFVGIHGTNRPDLLPGRVSTAASACAIGTSAAWAERCPSAPP